MATNRRVNEILITRCHAGAALTAAPLRAIGDKRNALDIAEMRDRHDHVFTGDEILIVHVRAALHDHAAARRAKFIANGRQLVFHDLLNTQTDDRMSR